MKLSRRAFLKTSLYSASGLVIGVTFTSSGPVIAKPKLKGFNPSVWINVSPDNYITVTVAKAEMGQAVMTSFPMLVAEEMDADWSLVNYRQAPVTEAYGRQSTGGSSSIREAWTMLREAGATARQMLVQAAARQWSVPPDACRTELNQVIHPDGTQRLKYGELSKAAANLPVPSQVQLKHPNDFKLIGHSPPRLDLNPKINGTAKFGIDQARPGMLYAAIRHSPVFDASVLEIDDSGIKNNPSVIKTVSLGTSVAVVAKDFWSAQQAVNRLNIKWSASPHEKFSEQDLLAKAKNSLTEPGETTLERGNFTQVFADSDNTLSMEYEFPFQAHATMEPMCCTAHVRNGECDVWVPTQKPNDAQWSATNAAFTGMRAYYHKLMSRITEQPPESVRIHSTLMGGGFGRRRVQDYVHEAVTISREVEAPVKLIWSREEDMQHDFYREWSYHRVEAAIDKQSGLPVAIRHRAVGPGVRTWGSHDMPYAIPNAIVKSIPLPHYVPLGSWRALAHTYNAYVVETMMDQIAAKSGLDPVELRLRLLRDSPRHVGVLKLAVEKSNWGRQLPAGHYLGVALHHCFSSYVAQVAEISLSGNQIRVHKVTCAIDCGVAVHPDQIAAQVESGVVFGLTAALKSRITIKDGRVEQSNFHDFPLLRFDEMPHVETHIVSSTEPPTGTGEPGVPPVAPAVANAVFSATGIMPVTLPISLSETR